MFQSLLVGVSSIEHSEPAIVTGLELARRADARIELLHATPVPHSLWPRSDPERLEQVNQAALANAREHLSEPLRALLERAGASQGVEELLRIVPGDAAPALLARARELSADLLVLGPHEKRKLIDFGSTARAVLAKADCAVLVQPGSFRPFRRILVPVDLSAESLHALERACALAAERDAKVVVLHGFSVPEFNYAAGMSHPIPEPPSVIEEVREGTRVEFERALAEIEWQGVEHEALFVDGPPVPTILERQNEFDLIVMGSHGRTGLAAAVLGSVAYAVLKQAEVPVLAMRSSGRDWLA